MIALNPKKFTGLSVFYMADTVLYEGIYMPCVSLCDPYILLGSQGVEITHNPFVIQNVVF